MPIVTGPDGAEIEFPDGTPTATMEAAMRAHYAPAAQESKAGHYAGLAGRAVVQAVPSAVAGLPALLGDAYDSLTNGVRMGYNAVAPSLGADKIDLIPTFRHSRAVADAGNAAASLLGLPEPQTKMERGLTDIGSAALAAYGGAGLAKGGASLLGSGPTASLLSEIGAQPALQAAGAAGGVTASNAARDANLPPSAQIGLGLVGSLVPGSAATLGERAAGGIAAAARPFTAPGKEVIGGRVLNQLATNPEMAAARMSASEPIIPGSSPTVSQVSKDPGLIVAESPAMAALNGSGRLAERMSEQNTARQKALDSISMRAAQDPANPDRGTYEYAKNKLDRTIDEQMKPAFRAAEKGAADYEANPLLQGEYGPGQVNLTPTFNTIDNILSTKSLAGRKDIQDAMKWSKDRLTQQGLDTNDPEVLYGVRKDLADAAKGKYDKDTPSLRLAAGQLGSVIKSVDAAIDQAAPGYRRYMDLYRERAKPLNQTDFIRDLRQSGSGKVSDPLSQDGYKPLLPASFQGSIQKAIKTGALKDARLSDSQLRVIQNVADDLDRGAAKTAATMRAPGSDTFRNFSVASIIGRVLGGNIDQSPKGHWMQAVAKPVSWMYGTQDEAIGNLLVDAMLDPHLAARMMKAATKYDVEFVGNELAKRAAVQSYGAAAHNQP